MHRIDDQTAHPPLAREEAASAQLPQSGEGLAWLAQNRSVSLDASSQGLGLTKIAIASCSKTESDSIESIDVLSGIEAYFMYIRACMS